MRSLLVLGSVAVVVTVLPALGDATDSTLRVEESGSVVALGNFACYPARFSSFAARNVRLTEQFVSRTALVGRPNALCSPASVGGRGSGDRRAHLTCHPIRVERPREVDVRVTDAFRLVTITIFGPRTLCVPSATATGGVLRPPPATLDTFACYLIESRDGFERRTVTVADHFDETDDVLIAPSKLCAPASMNTSRRLQSRLLACYSADSNANGRAVVVRSPLALLKASLGTRDELCVPSKAIAVD